MSETLLKNLVAMGAAVESVESGEENPLISLMCSRHEETGKYVSFLMRQGGQDQINQPGAGGKSALHIAARKGDLSGALELLNAGAEVNRQNRCAPEFHSTTPLHESVMPENGYLLSGRVSADKSLAMTMMLCERGADINAEDNHGWTPLVAAAAFCPYPMVIDELCRRGANVNHYKTQQRARMDSGAVIPPLHMAVQQNILSVIEKLLENGANAKMKSENEESALHSLASRQVGAQAFNAFLEQRENADLLRQNGEVALHDVVSRRDGVDEDFYASVTDALLREGGKLTVLDNNHNTPLHVAARGNAKAMLVFLKRGADPDCLNKAGLSPLWVAASKGHWEGVRLMRESGASTAMDQKVLCERIISENEGAKEALFGELRVRGGEHENER